MAVSCLQCLLSSLNNSILSALFLLAMVHTVTSFFSGPSKFMSVSNTAVLAKLPLSWAARPHCGRQRMSSGPWQLYIALQIWVCCCVSLRGQFALLVCTKAEVSPLNFSQSPCETESTAPAGAGPGVSNMPATDMCRRNRTVNRGLASWMLIWLSFSHMWFSLLTKDLHFCLHFSVTTLPCLHHFWNWSGLWQSLKTYSLFHTENNSQWSVFIALTQDEGRIVNLKHPHLCCLTPEIPEICIWS